MWPPLPTKKYLQLSPFIDLAGRLGSFLSQAAPRNIESIHITYAGALSEGKTELVRNAAIAGLLAQSESVNRINAATIAAERNIRILEEKIESPRGGTNSVLSITLHDANGSTRGSATVLHGDQPRLLAFDGMDIEAPLEGTLLVCRNLDVPGVIGNIGTVLAQQGVNIANFALGRERFHYSDPKDQVKALSVVQVDEPVGPEVLAALAKTPNLLQAKLVRFG